MWTKIIGFLIAVVGVLFFLLLKEGIIKESAMVFKKYRDTELKILNIEHKYGLVYKVRVGNESLTQIINELPTVGEKTEVIMCDEYVYLGTYKNVITIFFCRIFVIVVILVGCHMMVFKKTFRSPSITS